MIKENLETAPNLNFIFCSHPLDKKKVDEDYFIQRVDDVTTYV